jgi:hypothetical protein
MYLQEQGQPIEGMPEEQVNQEMVEMSSGLEKTPATSMDQVFIRESALAVNELQEHLEEQLRVEGAGACSWTEFALIGMNAKVF